MNSMSQLFIYLFFLPALQYRILLEFITQKRKINSEKLLNLAHTDKPA